MQGPRGRHRLAERIARLVGELERLAEEVGRAIREPLKEEIWQTLQASLWRLPRVEEKPLELLRLEVEEALGGPLEEVLEGIRRSMSGGSQGRGLGGGRGATRRGEQG